MTLELVQRHVVSVIVKCYSSLDENAYVVNTINTYLKSLGDLVGDRIVLKCLVCLFVVKFEVLKATNLKLVVF